MYVLNPMLLCEWMNEWNRQKRAKAINDGDGDDDDDIGYLHTLLSSCYMCSMKW